MVSRGDVLLDSPLAKIGGKGLFVKELEAGMLEGKADIAVIGSETIRVVEKDGVAAVKPFIQQLQD